MMRTRATAATRRHVTSFLAAYGLAVLAAGCGSSTSTTPTPTPTPPKSLPVVQLMITPNPVTAAQTSSTSTTVTYRVQATVTFQETAGTAGTITSVNGTLLVTPGTNVSGSLAVSLPFSAAGSVAGQYFQDLTLNQPATVTWQFSATGTDELGRPFTTQTAQVAINPPTPAPPPTVGVNRLELWGGTNYTQFLGCFNCNQFASDSLFNQFGAYGSQFSATSIWNQFSQYGSQFSPNSSCNQFATNPPRLIDTVTLMFGELTLNFFRPFAITDPSIKNWLIGTVCAH